MSTRTRTGPYTFADFLELIHEEKADLLEGAIYLASPESTEHNSIVLWLGTVLGQYIEERHLGRLAINKVAFRLTPTTAPEPDLGFVRTERMNIIRSGYVDGPPDVAVEFISPDSVERDYEHKRRLYEEAGVREYWIIDADEKRATFLIRGPEGHFAEAHLDGSTFLSRAIEGFHLNVEWLWQHPLPSTLATVQRLLQEK